MSAPVKYGQGLFVSEFDVPRLCDLNLCDLNRSPAVLGWTEWAIACQIDGRATVGQLAARSGIPVRDAVERVTRLVHGGLCTVDAGAAPGAGGQWPCDDHMPPLPRRVPDATLGTRPPLARPDSGLLKRILDGLNSLE